MTYDDIKRDSVIAELHPDGDINYVSSQPYFKASFSTFETLSAEKKPDVSVITTGCGLDDFVKAFMTTIESKRVQNRPIAFSIVISGKKDSRKFSGDVKSAILQYAPPGNGHEYVGATSFPMGLEQTGTIEEMTFDVPEKNGDKIQ